MLGRSIGSAFSSASSSFDCGTAKCYLFVYASVRWKSRKFVFVRTFISFLCLEYVLVEYKIARAKLSGFGIYS